MATTVPGVMHSEGRDRKRLKSNRAGDMVSTKLPVMAAASATAGESSSTAAARAQQGPCHHETALKTLNTDIDAMRSLVTCQVCHHFMYEPYALSCGHTYCYTCLSQWLGSNRKKTCPDCRTVIRQEPTPSYVIRELVLIFVGRTQLLPNGETSEEHHTMAKAEAETVAKDKANTDQRNGGLFKGCFKRHNIHQLPLHDPGDGVDRCPRCHWEIEDGYCNQCGVPVGDGFSDFDDDMSSDEEAELDHDLHDQLVAMHPGSEDDFAAHYDDFEVGRSSDEESEMDEGAFHAAFGAAPARVRMFAGRHVRGDTPRDTALSSESENDSSDDDEHDRSLDGFIDFETRSVDQSSMITDDSDDTEVQEVASRTRRPRAHVVISDDEDDEQSTQAGAISIVSSDDEGPIAGASNQRSKSRVVPRQRPIAVTSDEESSDDDHTEADHEPESGGFSPLQQYGESEVGSTSHYDDGSEAPNSVNGIVGHAAWSDAETESDYEEDSEHGWDTSTRAEARPSAPNRRLAYYDDHVGPRHHPSTNDQHRSRYFDSSASVASSLSGLAEAVSTASGNSTPHFHHPNNATRQASASRRGTAGGHPTHPVHPFQLSNTLANINNNHVRQQRTREAARSASAASSQSSPGGGGVDVRESSLSVSSNGSSQTITNERPRGRKRTFSRARDYELFAEDGQLYDDEDAVYDDDDDGEEEYY